MPVVCVHLPPPPPHTTVAWLPICVFPICVVARMHDTDGNTSSHGHHHQCRRQHYDDAHRQLRHGRLRDIARVRHPRMVVGQVRTADNPPVRRLGFEQRVSGIVCWLPLNCVLVAVSRASYSAEKKLVQVLVQVPGLWLPSFCLSLSTSSTHATCHTPTRILVSQSVVNRACRIFCGTHITHSRFDWCAPQVFNAVRRQRRTHSQGRRLQDKCK